MVSGSTWQQGRAGLERLTRSSPEEVYLRQLAPGELYRPVALHHDGLVLHGSLHHHKVIQQLIPDGGVQPSLANLLVKTRRSWGAGQKRK